MYRRQAPMFVGCVRRLGASMPTALRSSAAPLCVPVARIHPGIVHPCAIGPPTPTHPRSNRVTLTWRPPLMGGGHAAANQTLFCISALGSALFLHGVSGDTDEEADEFLNWSATHSSRPRSVFVPSSEDEVERIVQEHHEQGAKLRVIGSALSPNGIAFGEGERESWSPVCPLTGVCLVTDGTDALCLSDLERVVDIDKENMTVTVQAGITVAELTRVLAEHGLTLPNYASIDSQQMGGITQVRCSSSVLLCYGEWCPCSVCALDKWTWHGRASGST